MCTMFHYELNAELTDFMMMENIEEIKKYATFQHIEDKFVGNLFELKRLCRLYRVNDEDYNQDLIHAYEKCRFHFANDEYRWHWW